MKAISPLLGKKWKNSGRVGPSFLIVGFRLVLSLLGLCLLGSLIACSSPSQPGTEIKDSAIAEPQDIQDQEIESWLRPADGMVMVRVQAGVFQMGSVEEEITDAISFCRKVYSPCNSWYYEREGPQHSVYLSEYWIDQSEVTNEQYKKCIEGGICPEPTACSKGSPTYFDPEKSQHPVVCVSWGEAQQYCQWAGSRLPTEAEWEFAYRGVESRNYPWGDGFEGSWVNYCDSNCSASHVDQAVNDGYPFTAPVMTYPEGVSWSNAYNMAGNVFEWVADWFGSYSPEALENPLGPQDGTQKMAKGCSWYSPPHYCRGAARPSLPPEKRMDYLGFRCAQSAIPEN
jgi:formylglycine-generating enzyme required for sulfatase activity